MKVYPSIPSFKNSQMNHCISFLKYDGSNLKWLYQRNKGFCRQGTRTRLFDQTDPVFGCAISIFNATFKEPLEKLFRHDSYFREKQEITVYTEFFGENSFAGQHKHEDKKQLVMFDVSIYKYGLMSAKEFIKTFDGVIPIAKVIYKGECDNQFIEDIKTGKYEDKGVVEGVICKSGSGGHDILMCKIKTNSYLQKLKEIYKDKWQTYWE